MGQRVKSILMLVAMVTGVLFSDLIVGIDSATGGVLAPLSLFMMLFITFCGVDLREIKFSMVHLGIIAFQLLIGVASYYLLLPCGEVVAQGVMICFITPVAMAAVVVVKLLGGNVVNIASFSLLSNIVMALFIPLFFTHIGGEGCSFILILRRVVPIMVLPPLVSQTLRYMLPQLVLWFGKRGYLSFYIWLFSLTLTVGRTVGYISSNLLFVDLSVGLTLALLALLTCFMQYGFGWYVGKLSGESVAAEQSAGQKNTILAIWLAQTFLSPVASIAPTAYVVWQNIINSYKIYKHQDEKRSS